MMSNTYYQTMLYILIPAATTITAIFLTNRRRMKKMDHQSNSQRRMSFNSSGIAMGCFPEHVNYREPVIQVLISFSSLAALPSKDEVCGLIPRFLRVDRMKGIPTCINKEWVFDPCKDLNQNDMVRVVDVDCDNIQDLGKEVQNLVEYELRSPDRNLPWWEFVLLRNHSGVFEESMLVLRVDHAIGDGLSIGKLCTLIMTFEDGSVVKDLIPPKMRVGKEIRTNGNGIWSLVRMLGMVISAGLKVALLPTTRFDHEIAFAKGVVGKNAKDTRQRKTIIFDQYLPMDFVKAIKTAAGISFNDVLVVALSQAIHDFCHHSDCAVIKKHGAKARCRAVMTFGFPSNHEDLNDIIRNGWVPLSLCLGVGHTDIAHRIRHIKRGTSELKETPIALCQLALQGGICPYLPTSLYRKLVHMLYSRHTLTCTNVPGPDKQIFVVGKPVSSCRFSVGALHSVISFLSYNGQINICLSADGNAISGVHLLPIFYARALIVIAEKYNVAIPESVKVAAAKPLV